MARSRSFPSDFLKDPDIIALSGADECLILIKLLLKADDHGRGFAHCTLLGRELPVNVSCLDTDVRSTNQKYNASFRLRSQFRSVLLCTSLRRHSDERCNENGIQTTWHHSFHCTNGSTSPLCVRNASHRTDHSPRFLNAFMHCQQMKQRRAICESNYREMMSVALVLYASQGSNGERFQATFQFSGSSRPTENVLFQWSFTPKTVPCLYSCGDGCRQRRSSEHVVLAMKRNERVFDACGTPKSAPWERRHTHGNAVYKERSLVWQIVV